MSDNRVYSYSAVLMGSPILLKLCSHDLSLIHISEPTRH